jgi:hypothetical protein
LAINLVVVGNWGVGVDWGSVVSLDDWSVDNWGGVDSWGGLVDDCVETVVVIGGVVNSSD